MFKNHKNLSDDEYVEMIRKRDRVLRKLWWMWLALGILVIVCLIIFSYSLETIRESFGPDDTLTIGGFILGALFGFMYAGIWVQGAIALKNYVDSRSGYRTERLLLRYYDELKNRTRQTS